MSPVVSVWLLSDAIRDDDVTDFVSRTPFDWVACVTSCFTNEVGGRGAVSCFGSVGFVAESRVGTGAGGRCGGSACDVDGGFGTRLSVSDGEVVDVVL